MTDTKILSNNEAEMPISKIGSFETTEDDALFLDNIREIANLSKMRMEYNTIIHCRGGRILVEIGGNQQMKVTPGQLLLIPAGKVVQPILVSTDVDAGVLLVSERTLKVVLANQINIWNKAMYMKEIYVIDQAGWVNGLESYARSIFNEDGHPYLRREVLTSFLRTMLLMICEELVHHKEMDDVEDESTSHDKEIFNRFLHMLTHQEQKRQRVSFYAGKLNISSKYLSTITKRVSGKNPMRWITESVMQDCYRLLTETDMSVKEISNCLGFPNSSFFGQYFREQAGVTPMTYRARHKKAI